MREVAAANELAFARAKLGRPLPGWVNQPASLRVARRQLQRKQKSRRAARLRSKKRLSLTCRDYYPAQCPRRDPTGPPPRQLPAEPRSKLPSLEGWVNRLASLRVARRPQQGRQGPVGMPTCEAKNANNCNVPCGSCLNDFEQRLRLQKTGWHEKGYKCWR
jgi:hypothetical protein